MAGKVHTVCIALTPFGLVDGCQCFEGTYSKYDTAASKPYTIHYTTCETRRWKKRGVILQSSLRDNQNMFDFFWTMTVPANHEPPPPPARVPVSASCRPTMYAMQAHFFTYGSKSNTTSIVIPHWRTLRFNQALPQQEVNQLRTKNVFGQRIQHRAVYSLATFLSQRLQRPGTLLYYNTRERTVNGC
jgi:hypothetical protein